VRIITVFLACVLLSIACSKSIFAQTFVYAGYGAAYETNCPATSYTSSGTPAFAYVNVDASISFSIYNSSSLSKTTQTAITNFAALVTAAPPLVQEFTTLNFTYPVNQTIPGHSYGSPYNTAVYSGGPAGPGSYVAGADFTISDMKTGDSLLYDLPNVNVTIN